MLNTLNQLSMWKNRACLEEFKYVFGNTLGKHLWDKFQDMGSDLLGFWSHLDQENRKILASHIQDIVVSNSDKVSTKKCG